MNILKFKKYNEGYLDVDFDSHPTRINNTTYLVQVDGEKFEVIFHKRWMDSDPDCEMSKSYNVYDREYYSSDRSNPFKEDTGVDPRKVVIGVTRATIDFLERNNPRKVFIGNIDMKNEEGKRDPSQFNKRNRINYHYLEKMLPSGWDLERSTDDLGSSISIVRKK